MRYLGGKSRLAKQIAAAVAPRGPWWEPFCGGLSVSVQLAKYGPGLVSDVHPALVALYRAVREGWEPPTSVSRAEYEAARALPDTDPRKAFVGFGCSFGGKWFGGYAAEQCTRFMNRRSHGPPSMVEIDQVVSTARSLRRDLAVLAACELARLDFLSVPPEPDRFEVIYCDPPYAGVTGYGLGAFDHAPFWRRCAEWAALGVRVLVSEYEAHVLAEVVWQRDARDRLRAADGSQALKHERLFRVLPLASVADNDNDASDAEAAG